jgi:hypothetical protein
MGSSTQMIGLSNWIAGIVKSPRSRVIKEQIYAAESWRRICENPTMVVFRTPAGTKLPTQAVRIESDNRASVMTGPAGTAPVRQLIIYGIIHHSSLPDTVMKEGYTFLYDKDEYTCKDVIVTLGELQGIWEATG